KISSGGSLDWKPMSDALHSERRQLLAALVPGESSQFSHATQDSFRQKDRHEDEQTAEHEGPIIGRHIVDGGVGPAHEYGTEDCAEQRSATAHGDEYEDLDGKSNP